MESLKGGSAKLKVSAVKETKPLHLGVPGSYLPFHRFNKWPVLHMMVFTKPAVIGKSSEASKLKRILDTEGGKRGSGSTTGRQHRDQEP